MKTFFNLLIFTATIVDCARILVINSTPSYSHQIVIHPIVAELSTRGHEVVFVTTHPIRNKNLTSLKEIELEVQTKFHDITHTAKRSLFNLAFELSQSLVDASVSHLYHPELQRMIHNKTEHFDLVMVEYIVPIMAAFKVRFNCPLIGFSSLEGQNSDHKNFGNFDNPALYPDSLLFEPFANSFIQRAYNVFISIMHDLHREYVLYPSINKIIRLHFGKNFPDIGEIIRSADMLLDSSNIMLSTVRPITPSTIRIGGGIHLKEAKKLPKKIATLLDKSKRGTIYISFGSNIHSSQLSTSVLQVFTKTIAELPYDFLWKFEEGTLPNKSENLLLMKWIPQQDVLRHKNIKLFITQAGLQSLEEALYCGVPMLVIPFFADQIFNAHQITEKHIGVMIDDINILTSDQLKYSILELVENSMYRENIRKISRMSKDAPMKPIEKAIWWTEYVIKHRGGQHLKGPIVPFYQRYLFDVLGFFVFLLVLFVFFVFKVISCFNRCITKRKLKMH